GHDGRPSARRLRGLRAAELRAAVRRAVPRGCAGVLARLARPRRRDRPRALPQGQAEPAVGEHALAVWWVAQTPDQARSIARALRTLDKLARRDHPASEFCFMETEHHWRGRGAARFLRLGVGATN